VDDFDPKIEELKIKYEEEIPGEERIPWKSKQEIFNHWKLCNCPINPPCRCKQRKPSSMFSRFRKLKKSEGKLYRIVRDVRKGGTRFDKLDQIDKLLWNKFEDARSGMSLRVVHDETLRGWAKEIARKLDLEESKFKASDSYIYQFKKRHNIVSRKIVKFTSHTVEDQANIKKKAEEFRVRVRGVIDNMDPDLVINSDQTGFQRMMCSGRSLTFKGEQKTLAHSDNISGLTHSYTVQMSVTKERVLPKVFVVCQETTGDCFGPQVSERLYSASNLVIASSKSGKCKKIHVKKYNEEVLQQCVSQDFAYLLDGWSGQRDDKLFDMFNDSSFKCTRFEIPAGTTPLVQPLDVFFFRPYKSCVRRFYDGVANFEEYSDHENSLKMHLRNNYVKLHSLLNHQLCHEKYNSIVKHSWGRAGLAEPFIGDYPDMTRLMYTCTSLLCSDNDMEENCRNSSFIQCAHCEKSLCIRHFFIYNHRHDN